MYKNKARQPAPVRGIPFGSKESAERIVMSQDVERARLCKLLNLTLPSDYQLFGDALAEIERLEQAIADREAGRPPVELID